MSTSDPVISWWYAYLPLLPLAASAVVQPSGRLMDVRAVYSSYLRASPVLSACDALVVVVRCATYCAVLRVSLHKAILICCRDRFDEEEEVVVGEAGTRRQPTRDSPERRSTTLMSTAMRLTVFGLGVAGMICLALLPGGRDARWTAAWGWLFVGAYVPLEAVVQVYKWNQWRLFRSKTGAFVELESQGLTAKTDDDGGDNDDDDDNIDDDDVDIDDIHNRITDNEDDLAKDPRLQWFHKPLPVLLNLCYLVGGGFQAGILCWAFLDLVQPGLNRHVLAVDMVQIKENWDHVTEINKPLFYLSLPVAFIVMVLAFFLYVAICVLAGFLCILAYHGVEMAVTMLPPAIRCCSETSTSPGVFCIVCGAVVLIATGVVLFDYFIESFNFLGAPDRMWTYAMLTLELAAILLLLAACFLLYILLKLLAGRVRDWWHRRNTNHEWAASARHKASWLHPLMLHIDNDNSVGLLSLIVVAFVLSLVWYILRFADSAHWQQNWRDALVVNATANATNALNATNATGAAMATGTAAQPITLLSFI